MHATSLRGGCSSSAPGRSLEGSRMISSASSSGVRATASSARVVQQVRMVFSPERQMQKTEDDSLVQRLTQAPSCLGEQSC